MTAWWLLNRNSGVEYWRSTLTPLIHYMKPRVQTAFCIHAYPHLPPDPPPPPKAPRAARPPIPPIPPIPPPPLNKLANAENKSQQRHANHK